MSPGRRDPRPESLRRRAVPDWYRDAKLGIFVHWTPAAVAGFAPRERDIGQLSRERPHDALVTTPYTEWYENSIKFPGSPAARHHRDAQGGRPYAELAQVFACAAARFDPAAWAERFAAAGARWVVLVAKHHDGYCLWPSRVANPHRSRWHSERDCVGDLAAAVRARGMRFGVYYSGGLDWSFNPRRIRNLAEMIASVPDGAYPAYAEAQIRELIDRVRPDVLWNDIAWPGDRDALFRLFEDYYAAVPEGVVNDRWLPVRGLAGALRLPPLRWLLNALAGRRLRRPGALAVPPRPPHWDVRTPEYAVFPSVREEPWECVRGMDKSFGFNRASREEDFVSHDALIRGLADGVAKNGNLLLNVGPRGEDAAIPEPQLRRLDWLGEWLSRNGEALYGTRPWRRAEGSTAEGVPLRFTARAGVLYAILLGTPPGRELTLHALRLEAGAQVALLGEGPLPWQAQGADLRVSLRAPLAASPAHALRLAPGPC